MFNKLFLTDSSGNGILMSLLLLNPPSAEDTFTENEHPLFNASVIPSTISLSVNFTSLFINILLFQKPS